jgi:DNA-binding transcriptional ArsR family regulator
MFRAHSLPEAEVYEILANRRRRETIRHLSERVDGARLSLRDLSEAIAVHETGDAPPPRAIRESVYNSLHQTHLPKLEELGVVDYDREERIVTLRERARDVNIYMGVVTRYGLTWSEIYRTLGVVALTVVVAALAEVPVVGSVAPLAWTTAFLLAFVVATSYQLWSNRWRLKRAQN